MMMLLMTLPLPTNNDFKFTNSPVVALQWGPAYTKKIKYYLYNQLKAKTRLKIAILRTINRTIYSSF